MDNFNKLIKIFGDFPGIGPRQAKRFVYFIMTRSNLYIDDMINNIEEVRKSIRVCNDCKRIYEDKNKKNICNICSDKDRDSETIMVIARDIDFESIEKSGIYNGKYFILGGTIPYLEKNPEQKIRINDLLNLINKNGTNIKNVIISMNATGDGDSTTEYLFKTLKQNLPKIDIFVLGRGLSTGSELEYADRETIFNALSNKTKL